MDARKLYILGILMVLMAVSESSSIARRPPPKAEDGELEKDKKSEFNPDIWDPEGFDWEGHGLGNLPPPDQPSDPETDGNEIERKKPDESIPPVPDSSGDGPKYDGGEEDEKSFSSDMPPIHDEGEESTDEEDAEPNPQDEETPVGGEKDESDEEGDEDELGKIPNFGGDTQFWNKPGFWGSSSFDTPFFNLEQVRKYFNQLERALGHVFRETMDEARLLNGTYANTTEEEVTIDGKKYTVQKSVINSADNHTSIYVETLSSKQKGKDGKEAD